MKSYKFYRLMASAAVVVLATASCTKENPAADTEEIMTSGIQMSVLQVKSDGTTTFDMTTMSAPFDSTADLTASEIEYIYAVREDEKLAGDLYSAFFEMYKIKTFENIAKAEINHMKATERLLEYYGITYPVAGDKGKFENPVRQALYDSLLQKGSTALEAFKVMAQYEEYNIVQYKADLAVITNENLKIVIENLEKGSENHFKATIRQITALGGTYSAQVMTQEEYSAIIATGFEQGKRYRYLNNGQSANSGEKMNGKQEKKGSVNASGTCTGCSNGSFPGNGGGNRNGKGNGR
ncbi:MAG: DUF2202 domain-containing protein [Bacteroidales bacterium]|nr:DUF2202 domain-containing protein [Bacteroidales bacterium]